MIDIHHHCLPGIDDGPRGWSEAVDLCKASADEGIETVIATPHVLRGQWQNTKRATLEALCDELRARTGDRPHLLLGSEYFFGHDMNEVLRTGGGIVPLAGSRYILLEFAAHAIPPLVEQPLYRAQLDGWIPIIAHPERNLVLQTKPELLKSLMRLGAKAQISSGSLTGQFGSSVQKIAIQWLKKGLVHFVATDAHNVTRRPPIVREARRLAVEMVGEEVAEALFAGNPRAVVENCGLVHEPDLPYPVEKASFFERLRKYLRKS
jgi:protein-tyrosine phosphatase